MNIENSRVLITGGSLGIGKATAKLLVDGGAKVAITGRDQGRLDQAANECGALGIRADVSNLDDIELSYNTFIKEFGGIDVLINNAAFGKMQTLLELDPEDMLEVWQTNVLGATMMAKKAAEYFVKQERGTIVNIASTAALRGYAGGSLYSSSKFALRSLSECWRAELRKYNVRVITICPSEVTTAFGSELRVERPERDNRLRAQDIAHTIKAALEMDDRGFIPELSVFATNPW